MIKRIGSCILFIFFMESCSVEKINLSPISQDSAELKQTSSAYTASQRKNLIFYSSEITNLIASFPKFRNDAVNKEVSNLKYQLKDYIGAMEEYNLTGLNKADDQFEKSYKKLQRLRKYLNKDEDEVLNRYLVRIKTTMYQLNSNIPTDSTTTN